MPESILSASRLFAAWTLAVWLMAGIVFAGGATLARADQTASGQDLGSADDYLRNNPDPADAYEIPLLGIAVKNETEWLGRSRWRKYGRWVSGVEILAVIPGGPGGAAHLRGSQLGVLHTTALITGLVAAAFFPPAMIGVMALSKAVESHDMIIAVDGKRTCDVTDFEEAIQKVEAGEVVYLTVVRHSRREQIRVALPVR
jgi:S1-C subfamily serine protease